MTKPKTIKIKEIYTYEVVSCECKNKWKDIREIPRVYDRLVDRRRKDGLGEIMCGCCNPPRDIFVRIKKIERQ